MTVPSYAKKINNILQSIMTETLGNCKHHDPEISQCSARVNNQAHECSKLLEKLESEYRKEKFKLKIKK